MLLFSIDRHGSREKLCPTKTSADLRHGTTPRRAVWEVLGDANIRIVIFEEDAIARRETLRSGRIFNTEKRLQFPTRELWTQGSTRSENFGFAVDARWNPGLKLSLEHGFTFWVVARVTESWF